MDTIPDITPNANLAKGCFNDAIKVDSINLTDITITKQSDDSIDSMAPNNVESIGDIKINL